MEKLRKTLEKKAASFQLEKQNAADVVNVFSEREQKPSVFPQSSVRSVVTVGSPSRAEMARPFTGGVKHTQHLHNVAAYTIRNDVRSAGHDQLPGSGYSSGSASSGKSLQTLDRPCNRRHGPGGSIGIVLGYVLGRGDQVRARCSQPINAHVASSA